MERMDAQAPWTWPSVRASLATVGPALVTAIALITAFWLGGRLLERLIDRVGRQQGLAPDLLSFLSRSSRVAALVVGLVTALGTIGVDVKALVAGVGITGFALGFALRDIVSNLLAGVLLLLHRPFRRGDRIQVAGSEGVVREIDLRYTRLEAEDGTRLLVPNSILFTNPIRVESRSAPE
jgi:small-conductance mechanosensitive channel